MAAKWRVLHAGTLRTITKLRIKQGGVLRTIRTLKVMDGGTLRTVAILADPLTVSVPSPAIEDGPGGFTATVRANVTATPSGGLSPYTYSWAYVSGDPITVTNSTSATATFSASLAAGASVTGTFRVTCTDSGAQTATDDVLVTLYNPTV